MDVTCELIRSHRKSVALEVTRDGRVLIRAPWSMSRAAIDDFYLRHTQWLEAALQRQQQWAMTHPEPTAQEEAALRARAAALLPEKTARYAAVMGLQPAGITITSARTRFGSCSPRNRISYSWRLMQYPEAAIDYVVVHELAHLVHRNHGPEFYALIASVLPDYRQRRALLK